MNNSFTRILFSCNIEEQKINLGLKYNKKMFEGKSQKASLERKIPPRLLLTTIISYNKVIDVPLRPLTCKNVVYLAPRLLVMDLISMERKHFGFLSHVSTF